MKKTIFIVLVAMLLLVACEKKTDLIIHNKTNHNVYYTLDNGTPQTLSGQNTRAHTFELGKTNIFGETSKTINISVEGETYQLPHPSANPNDTTDVRNLQPHDFKDTKITLTSQNNYHIYLWPRTASLRIKNNSDRKITGIKWERLYPNNTTNNYEKDLINEDEPLMPGQEVWCRIQPMDAAFGENWFYYNFRIYSVEIDNPLSMPDLKIYGGEFMQRLEKDIQYVIDFTGIDW